MGGLLLSVAIWLAAATLPVVHGGIWETREQLSIGTTHPLSPDGRQIPGWALLGVSQILRDRVIMTPLHPGSVRSAVWCERANSYDEWSAELEFRANGEDRSGGSFNFWYTAGTSIPKGTDSVYTAKPWDGLAILVDKYGPYGGSVRAFLNDGKTDFSIHHNIASLPFAHCDFPYRNQGTPSKIKITHTLQGLKVETDGSMCFETKEVRLAPNNNFGVSAASADSPDSFELFSLKISSPQAGQPGSEPEVPQKQSTPQDVDNTKQSQKDNQGTVKESQERLSPSKLFEAWKEEVPEHPANFYKSAEDQFSDLHDRLTALTHYLGAIHAQIGAVYERVGGAGDRMDSFLEEIRNKPTSPSREQFDRVEARLSAVEGVLRDLEKVLHSKDYQKHFDTLHSALREQTSNLMNSVPGSVANAVVQQRDGKLTWGVWIVLLAQVILVVGYVWHKRRKGAMPKKYL